MASSMWHGRGRPCSRSWAGGRDKLGVLGLEKGLERARQGQSWDADGQGVWETQPQSRAQTKARAELAARARGRTATEAGAGQAEGRVQSTTAVWLFPIAGWHQTKAELANFSGKEICPFPPRFSYLLRTKRGKHVFLECTTFPPHRNADCSWNSSSFLFSSSLGDKGWKALSFLLHALFLSFK